MIDSCTESSLLFEFFGKFLTYQPWSTGISVRTFASGTEITCTVGCLFSGVDGAITATLGCAEYATGITEMFSVLGAIAPIRIAARTKTTAISGMVNAFFVDFIVIAICNFIESR